MTEGYYVYASGSEINALCVTDDDRLMMDFEEVSAHVTERLRGALYVGQFAFQKDSPESAVREVMEHWALLVLDYKRTNPERAAKLSIPVGATYTGPNTKLTHLGCGSMS
jgi:hypothetical protein